MVEPRFYEPSLDAGRDSLRLEGDEGHHLARVLRLGPGARVRVFDGRGLEVRAEIVRVERAVGVLRVLEVVSPPSPSIVALTLVQAVLKGDKMDEVVRDATMIGVASIQPVVTARTIVAPKSFGPGGATAVARWRRVAVSSAKQCGRAVLPAIEPPRPLAEALAQVASEQRLMLVEPSAAGMSDANGLPEPPRTAALLVGPEGGWTDEEVTAARAAGWTPWSLGPLTLRADAAALVAAAAALYTWRRSIATARSIEPPPVGFASRS